MQNDRYFQTNEIINLFAKVDLPLITAGQIEPFKKALQEANYFDSEMPRLFLLGEFKSGKSTFLNALLGEKYAATDALEMTSWVARYWPSKEKFCRIRSFDGIEKTVKPEEFLDKCQNRLYTMQELNSIDRVDIGYASTTCNYSIIDTPGFGSTTIDNERRVINSLNEADLVIWVESIESIGSMREVGIIKLLKHQNTPIICVLTKCDLLDSDEIVQVQNYIEKEFQFDSKLIFPFSSKNYFAGNELESKHLDSIKSFISENVSILLPEYRKQAQAAHDERLTEHALYLIDLLSDNLQNAFEAEKQCFNLLESISTIILTRLKNSLQDHINSSYFVPYRDKIKEAWTSNGRNLNNEIIVNVISKVLPADYEKQYWDSLLFKADEIFRSAWMEMLEQYADEVKSLVEKMSFNYLKINEGNSLANINTGKFTTSNTNNQQISDDVFKTGIRTTAGIAAFVTAYAALLGPAAGVITIGMAASGLGLPIALIGIGVSAVMLFITKKRGTEKFVNVDELMNQLIGNYIEMSVDKTILTCYKEKNQLFAKEVLLAMTTQQNRHIPSTFSIESLLSKLNSLKSMYK